MTDSLFNDRHFHNALITGNDFDLKPYWDAAEIIARARFKGASSDDIKLCVNESLFDLYLKLDKFDPDKGTFRTFFNRIVGNSISEIREELKPESLRSIDKSIKRGSVEEAAERPVSVSLDERFDLEDEDFVALTERRKHLEEGLDAFKAYIDQLPYIERRMMYGALGKILEPAEYNDVKKKGYVDEITALTGQTAEYIRLMVHRRKQEAIESTQRQGYNRNSIVSYGFLTRLPSPVVEFSFDGYSPFEQYMMCISMLKILQAE